MIALRVRALAHAFGRRRVLGPLDVVLPQGCFGALVGPNGSGKTTLMSLLCGLYRARQGSVEVMGRDLAREPVAALRCIGIVFQQQTLDPDLTVEENLRFHAALHDLSPNEGRQRIADELDRFEAAQTLRRRVRTLSGGERRRIEIARALLPSPRLLLLDEPTAGLDPQSRAGLRAHVLGLCRDRGVAVLWATHLLEEAASADLVLDLAAPARPSS
jgi:ABC-2 type transport system ATP-binding protein